MRLVLTLPLVACLGLSLPAAADLYGDCEQEQDAQLSIDACTALMESGQVTEGHLATAYFLRGSSHLQLGQYDLAVADYSEALEIEPWNTIIHGWRGRANCLLGEFEDAVEDFTLAFHPSGGFGTPGEAQTALRDHGYYDGPIDGILGPASLDALRAWMADSCDLNALFHGND